MKKHLDISHELNSLFQTETPKKFLIGNAGDMLSTIASAFSRGKVEVVITEKNFKRFGSAILEGLRTGGAEVKVLFIEDKDFYYTQVKTSFNSQVGAVIGVGDKNLLSAVRYYSSLHGVPCFAILTTPIIENVLEGNVSLKTEGLPAKMKAQSFNKVIIDQEIIKKASGKYFAEAYTLTVSKLTSLIDYKINAYVAGEKVSPEIFQLVKKAINVSATLFDYSDYKTAIIFSQILLAIAKGECEGLCQTGIETVLDALHVFAPNTQDYEKAFIAFEKTAKLYHLYFSNDFANFLAVPDYFEDLELLQSATNRDKSFFYNNLKIPSEKKRQLINLLISKTKGGFCEETTVILKILNGVKILYDKLLNGEEKSIISYKQIKNAVTLSPYLSCKTSVLTLCRDAGVLKCAN